MVAQVKGFNCQPNRWTEISSGFDTVQVRCGSGQYGFISFGSSPPSDPPSSNLNYIEMDWSSSESFNFKDTNTKVYFFPGTSMPANVKVIAE